MVSKIRFLRFDFKNKYLKIQIENQVNNKKQYIIQKPIYNPPISNDPTNE